MVADVDLKVLVTMVNKEDVYETAIVGIHDACPSVKAELCGKTTTRGYSAISARRDRDREVGVDEGSSASRHSLHFGAMEVVTSGVRRATSRNSCTRRMLFDLQGDGRRGWTALR